MAVWAAEAAKSKALWNKKNYALYIGPLFPLWPLSFVRPVSILVLFLFLKWLSLLLSLLLRELLLLASSFLLSTRIHQIFEWPIASRWYAHKSDHLPAYVLVSWSICPHYDICNGKDCIIAAIAVHCFFSAAASCANVVLLLSLLLLQLMPPMLAVLVLLAYCWCCWAKKDIIATNYSIPNSWHGWLKWTQQVSVQPGDGSDRLSLAELRRAAVLEGHANANANVSAA